MPKKKKKDEFSELRKQLTIIEELLIEALTVGYDPVEQFVEPGEDQYIIPTALLDEVEIITGIRPNFMAIT
jgi:hypothetical protein